MAEQHNVTHERKESELDPLHFEEGEREVKWNFLVRQIT